MIDGLVRPSVENMLLLGPWSEIVSLMLKQGWARLSKSERAETSE
jgi:hypothetical protein